MDRRQCLGVMAAAPFALKEFYNSLMASDDLYPEKAKKIHEAVMGLKYRDKDQYVPEINEIPGLEKHTVLVRRIFDNGKYQFWVYGVRSYTDKTKKHEIDGMQCLEISRRTLGDSVASYINMRDDKLDGIVDNGMTRKTRGVVLPTDKRWNEICDEPHITKEKISYGKLFQQTYNHSLDSLIEHLGLKG